MEKLTAGPFTYCIYCGRRDRELTDEHIVPYALGGLHILESASCVECQRDINQKIESPLLSQMLLPVRARHKYPSRSKAHKNVRLVRLASMLEKNLQAQIEEIPFASYKGPTFMAYVVNPPHLLSGVSIAAPPEYGAILGEPIDITSPGGVLFNFPIVDFVARFAQMLAKIALGYLYFSGRPFKPLLIGVLRGSESWVPHIGGAKVDPIVGPDQRYHLAITEVNNFLVVSIGLFLGTTVAVNYDVVAGLKISEPAVPSTA